MPTMTHEIATDMIKKTIRKTITSSTYLGTPKPLRFDYIKHRDRLLSDIIHLGRKDFLTFVAALKAEINRLSGEIRAKRADVRAAHKLASAGAGDIQDASRLTTELNLLRAAAHNAIQMRLATREWARIEYAKRQEWQSSHQSAKPVDIEDLVLQDTPEQRAIARLILDRIVVATPYPRGISRPFVLSRKRRKVVATPYPRGISRGCAPTP